MRRIAARPDRERRQIMHVRDDEMLQLGRRQHMIFADDTDITCKQLQRFSVGCEWAHQRVFDPWHHGREQFARERQRNHFGADGNDL